MSRRFPVEELMPAVEATRDCLDLIANAATSDLTCQQVELIADLAETIVQAIDEAQMDGEGLIWVCGLYRQEDRSGGKNCFACGKKRHGKGHKGCNGFYLVPLRIVLDKEEA